MSIAEENLRHLGLTLPEPAAPVANYVPWVKSGNTLYVSGQVSRHLDGSLYAGKLGQTLTVEQGYEAARFAALYTLAVARSAVGGLDRVRALRMLGMVNATPEFTDHPRVMNGASDLLVAVLGERGTHARAAVGMGSLPLGVAVEVEVFFEVGA